jgi:hypothetical protein
MLILDQIHCVGYGSRGFGYSCVGRMAKALVGRPRSAAYCSWGNEHGEGGTWANLCAGKLLIVFKKIGNDIGTASVGSSHSI